MADPRSAILAWCRAGAIDPPEVGRALRLAGAVPDAAGWRRFLTVACFSLGALLLASAAVYFVAFNWQALPRFAKFALAEGALVAAVVVALAVRVDSIAGTASLAAAVVLTGALLALTGQTYQTGADPWELFAAWAVLALPWTVVARSAALWIFWLAIVDIAAIQYCSTFRLLALFSGRDAAFAVLAVDGVALVAWEALAAAGVREFAVRWAPRVLAYATGAAATTLAIPGWHGGSVATGLAPYAACVAVLLWAYRVRTLDLAVLAGVALSATVVLAWWLGETVVGNHAGGLMLLALVVVSCTAAAAWWLRGLARSEAR
jgi:uncharacterized membrane protein